MMNQMKILLIALILPTVSFCQEKNPDYLFGKIELDPKNVIYGSDKNEPGIDAVISFGYRSEGGTQMQFSYETFKEIEYKATYFEAGHFFNATKKFQQGIMAGAGLIFRDVDWCKYQSCTVSLSGNLEYHVTEWMAVTAKFEGRYRGDIDQVIPSVYSGVEFKVF